MVSRSKNLDRKTDTPLVIQPRPKKKNKKKDDVKWRDNLSVVNTLAIY